MQLHKAVYGIVIIVMIEDETYEKIVLATQRTKFSALKAPSVTYACRTLRECNVSFSGGGSVGFTRIELEESKNWNSQLSFIRAIWAGCRETR